MSADNDTVTSAVRLRRHKGDIMSPETRSRVMSKIRGKGTGLELLLARAMAERAWQWEEHCGDLPGRPDFVFRSLRVAIFVDGDFWHGWRFPQWRDKLSEKWEEKIGKNRARDARNHRRLRCMGWKVIRIWEHQTESDLTACVDRISRALKERLCDGQAPK